MPISLLFSFSLTNPSSFSNQEGGRSKSHRYWPKLGSKHNSATHGKFKVTTKFRTDSGCYATTGLKVKHLLSGQERTVWHLQYTDWPEQGCPEYVQGFLCEWDYITCLTIRSMSLSYLASVVACWICAVFLSLGPPTCSHSHYLCLLPLSCSLPGGDPVCKETH